MALGVWLNINMLMGSGQDSYDTYKVWCIFNTVHSSYKHFALFGESLKMAAMPCSHHDSKKKDFNNFWFKRGEEYTQQFSWESDKIPRKSLLKYTTCKLPKMAVWFKMADLSLPYSGGDFFVDLGVIHMSTKFHWCRWKGAPGLQFRGAGKPFGPTHLRNRF